jgi:hypothetical protein
MIVYVRVAPRKPEQSLAEFIRLSQERWRAAMPDTRIGPAATVARDNGKTPFTVFHYQNPTHRQQPFEIVAFGEDSDRDQRPYVVMAVLSALDRKALAAAEPAYRALLRAH